ncbi:MAG: 5-formyltetrahydrofolate cyclo-ligase [Burkholderiales bacterium]|nr:MAG: 5-formyltetrahydrofolate cyclo-ligase [Burkholderiales bacterium]RPH67622.1 MAG: 5-formyltetrahydrofolate cyclo-ligase [Burkholderiales bacterium]
MIEATTDPGRWASWRSAERRRLIAERLAMPAGERRRGADRIGATLDRIVGDASDLIVAVYWPIRGEPDLRGWIDSIRARGARCALPVVVAPGVPLVFRRWDAGARLQPGIWNIPVPADGDRVTPHLVIAPVVGYDVAGYRLGYGGGYYDRTLAAAAPRPRAIGVGYARSALPSIDPQPHDIPMDAIVTDGGVVPLSHQLSHFWSGTRNP